VEAQDPPQPILAGSPVSHMQAGDVPRIDTSVSPEFPSILGSPGSNADWDVGGELYRRKIEALRDKVGNGYLSVLSEEGWDPTSRASDYHEAAVKFGAASPTSRHNPATISRPTTVQAIHSGGLS
jgi:hypothetical protein